MRRFIKRTLRPITWTLAVAFAVVLSAQCVTAEDMTPAQQACCVVMGHDCGPMIQQDCCAMESHNVDQLVAVKSVSVKPVLTLVATPFATPVSVYVSTPLLQAAHDRSLQPLADVPTYLRVSALLI